MRVMTLILLFYAITYRLDLRCLVQKHGHGTKSTLKTL
jgi:hypothetical protein